MSHDKHDHEDDDIGCLEAINGLYAYLDGELDDAEAIAQIEHHMSHCRNCFSRNELENALTERIRKSVKDKTPESVQNRLKDLMDKF